MDDVTYDMFNLICNVAQYSVYQNYIKCSFKGKKYSVINTELILSFIVKSYLESVPVSNYKFGKEGEVQKIQSIVAVQPCFICMYITSYVLLINTLKEDEKKKMSYPNEIVSLQWM